jgi:cysteine synthase A
MREQAPHVRIVAVDVTGSCALGFAAGPRILTGIGSARRSDFVGPGTYDDAVIVSADEAVMHCRALRSATGISVGASSGAALAACASVCARRSEVVNPVCVCPDGGAGYEDTVYDDSWVSERGLRVDGECAYDRVDG